MDTSATSLLTSLRRYTSRDRFETILAQTANGSVPSCATDVASSLFEDRSAVLPWLSQRDWFDVAEPMTMHLMRCDLESAIPVGERAFVAAVLIAGTVELSMTQAHEPSSVAILVNAAASMGPEVVDQAANFLRWAGAGEHQRSDFVYRWCYEMGYAVCRGAECAQVGLVALAAVAAENGATAGVKPSFEELLDGPDAPELWRTAWAATRDGGKGLTRLIMLMDDLVWRNQLG